MSTINKHYIRDLLISTIEISRRSRVPMLYLGNPGYGKTTIVNMYAEYCYKQYNKEFSFHVEEVKAAEIDKMHVESVIGSAFDRSEILGYMVNDPSKDPDFLTMKDPEWYHRIIEYEKKGIPSFLFIDEIPTTPKDVQGSLYRLIFERVLNSGHKLPEDCVIISAGNYKANLPVQCDITSPSLTRFCIINLQPRSFKELIEEASLDLEERIENLPSFKTTELTKDFRKRAKEFSKDVLNAIEDTYSGADTSKGEMDVNNTDLAGMYDAEYSDGKAVYNVLNMRTIGYFHDCFAAIASMGITDKDVIGQIVDGLIGLGFNSFSDYKELNAYRKFAKARVVEALKNFKNNKKEESKFEFTAEENSISAKVEKLSLVRDSLTSSNTADAMSNIVVSAIVSFPIEPNAMYETVLSHPERVSELKSDLNALEKFSLMLDELPNSKSKTDSLSLINNILDTYKFYKIASN